MCEAHTHNIIWATWLEGQDLVAPNADDRWLYSLLHYHHLDRLWPLSTSVSTRTLLTCPTARRSAVASCPWRAQASTSCWRPIRRKYSLRPSPPSSRPSPAYRWWRSWRRTPPTRRTWEHETRLSGPATRRPLRHSRGLGPDCRRSRTKIEQGQWMCRTHYSSQPTQMGLLAREYLTASPYKMELGWCNAVITKVWYCMLLGVTIVLFDISLCEARWCLTIRVSKCYQLKPGDSKGIPNIISILDGVRMVLWCDQ